MCGVAASCRLTADRRSGAKGPGSLLLGSWPAGVVPHPGIWLGEFFEGVKYLEPGTPEIPIIACGDGQPMPAGSRRDVAVFDGHALPAFSGYPPFPSPTCATYPLKP